MFFIDRIGSFIKPVAAYTILRVDIFIIVPQLEQTTVSFGVHPRSPSLLTSI